MTTNDEQNWLTAGEAARIIDAEIDTVLVLVANGKLKSRTVPRDSNAFILRSSAIEAAACRRIIQT